jgi:hypothetical protein
MRIIQNSNNRRGMEVGGGRFFRNGIFITAVAESIANM